eukprot:365617-Chlamydomonas_euryale.AAC.5
MLLVCRAVCQRRRSPGHLALRARGSERSSFRNGTKLSEGQDPGLQAVPPGHCPSRSARFPRPRPAAFPDYLCQPEHLSSAAAFERPARGADCGGGGSAGGGGGAAFAASADGSFGDGPPDLDDFAFETAALLSPAPPPPPSLKSATACTRGRALALAAAAALPRPLQQPLLPLYPDCDALLSEATCVWGAAPSGDAHSPFSEAARETAPPSLKQARQPRSNPRQQQPQQQRQQQAQAQQRAPQPQPCLAGVSLVVPRGELTVVVGSVGAGKSSLLAALCGDLCAVSGRWVEASGSCGVHACRSGFLCGRHATCLEGGEPVRMCGSLCGEPSCGEGASLLESKSVKVGKRGST